MLEDEWLSHGPASINLLIARQSERDRLLKVCTAIIAGQWSTKPTTLATFFPEYKEEEERAKRVAEFENLKARINSAAQANGKRNRKLEGRGTKGT